MRAGTYPIKMNMRSLLIGIAALFLATAAARADNIDAECGRFDQQCRKKERALAYCDLLFDYGIFAARRPDWRLLRQGNE